LFVLIVLARKGKANKEAAGDKRLQGKHFFYLVCEEE
jgi:hypothetical protein